MSAVLCLPACLRVSAAASRGQAPHENASIGGLDCCHIEWHIGLAMYRYIWDRYHI